MLELNYSRKKHLAIPCSQLPRTQQLDLLFPAQSKVPAKWKQNKMNLPGRSIILGMHGYLVICID